jgi:hypothetical protein
MAGDVRNGTVGAAGLVWNDRAGATDVEGCWLWGAVAAAVLTPPVLWFALTESDGILSASQATILAAGHFPLAALTVGYAFVQFRRTRDLFHPSVIGAVTFAVFHVLLNPVILSDYSVQQSAQEDAIWGLMLRAYGVVAVAWIGYVLGHAWLSGGPAVRGHAGVLRLPRTDLFLVVGLVFVLIGVIGNAGSVGGFETYLQKILRFWERSDLYMERSLDGNHEKWTCLAKFLAPGILVLAHGLHLKLGRASSVGLLACMLAVGAVANLLLGCANGARGSMLMMAFLGLPLMNHVVKTSKLGWSFIRGIRMRRFVLLAVGLLLASYLLGRARDVGEGATGELSWNSATRFAFAYLTNFRGTYRAAVAVNDWGTANGETLLGGAKNMLGGETPPRTETEMPNRVWIHANEGNARYGPPAEFYFNYGWIGVFVGMAVVGALVKSFSLLYARTFFGETLSNGILAAFLAFSAYFVVIANLSYLPPYFVLHSAPYYFILWAFQRVAC